MSDINLLPNDLRNPEAESRRRAEAEMGGKGVEFSSGRKSGPSDQPSSWQRLLSAIRTNLARPAPELRQLGASTHPQPQPTSHAAASAAAGSAPLPPRVVNLAPVVPPAAASVSVAATPAPASGSPAPAAPARQAEPEAQPASKAPVPGAPPATPAAKFKTQPPQPPVGSLLEVNLIPASAAPHASRTYIRVALVLACALVLVGGAYLVLQARARSHRAELLAASQHSLELQVILEQDRAAAEASLATARKLSALADLMADRQSWLPVFSLLEHNTLPGIYFSDFAGDASGSLTLTGHATSYTEAARQLLAFQTASEVAAVSLVGLKPEGDDLGSPQVGFTLALTLKPSLFSQAK